MFKKTLLVGAIALAASSVALADGFYVGAGIGADSFNSKNTLTSDVGTLTVDQGKTGAIGSLLAGYNWNFANQFNLGLEAFANATSSKIETTFATDAGTDTLSTKNRYNYGVRAVPGYQVTPDTDLHAIVGYVRGNFKLQSDGSTTINRNGFQVGLGSGTNVAKNVAVRGDVIYSGYQSKTWSDSTGDSYKIQPNSLDGIVSVAYKFG